MSDSAAGTPPRAAPAQPKPAPPAPLAKSRLAQPVPSAAPKPPPAGTPEKPLWDGTEKLRVLAPGAVGEKQTTKSDLAAPSFTSSRFHDPGEAFRRMFKVEAEFTNAPPAAAPPPHDRNPAARTPSKGGGA